MDTRFLPLIVRSRPCGKDRPTKRESCFLPCHGYSVGRKIRRELERCSCVLVEDSNGETYWRIPMHGTTLGEVNLWLKSIGVYWDNAIWGIGDYQHIGTGSGAKTKNKATSASKYRSLGAKTHNLRNLLFTVFGVELTDIAILIGRLDSISREKYVYGISRLKPSELSDVIGHYCVMNDLWDCESRLIVFTEKEGIGYHPLKREKSLAGKVIKPSQGYGDGTPADKIDSNPPTNIGRWEEIDGVG